MWHRRRASSDKDRTGGGDPIATAIWEDGSLGGSSTAAPVINAPRAGDLIAGDAA
jgi:hypothetical protein